jgi:hypothetical protein
VSRGRWLALAALFAASLVAQARAELAYAWERIPGFYAFYGFLGCLAIIFVSKWLGRLFIQRDEGYYDRE